MHIETECVNGLGQLNLEFSVERLWISGQKSTAHLPTAATATAARRLLAG